MQKAHVRLLQLGNEQLHSILVNVREFLNNFLKQAISRF